MSNPVATMRLDDVLKPWIDLTQQGFTALGATLREIEHVLQMMQTDQEFLVQKQKKTFILRNADSDGAPYQVRYEGHKYMDVMAWRTDDITTNPTANVTIPVLGMSPAASPLTLISVFNMLLAGSSPWLPLNLPELTTIELVKPAAAGKQCIILVRYGMESWGLR